MIGHNWGTEHAERWVWLEGTGFEDAPTTYFDAGAARIKLGPLDDALDRRRGCSSSTASGTASAASASPLAQISESADRLRLRPARQGHLVRGRVRRREKDFVGWVYADPRARAQHVNCSISDLELTVEREGQPPRTLSLPAAPHTSSGCGRPTTGSRSSPIRTAEVPRRAANDLGEVIQRS